ncbi:Knottin, scorpion toxin-like [Sesbania bispinosa]|nr:Knottin, scorpion toxin-like [Sesbania bispinosa]
MVEAKICQKYSKTWSGWCGNSNHCDNQCKKWEGAKFGSCHYDSRGRACFCYFNCPGLCAKRSKTWSGICISSKNCDKQCRTKEGASHGACHGNLSGRACDCYFKC